MQYLFFSFKDYRLTFYDNLIMLMIKTFVLKFRMNEMFLTSITAKQMTVLCMLLLLFCILIIVQSISMQIDQHSKSSLFCKMWKIFESFIKNLLFQQCSCLLVILKMKWRKNLMCMIKLLKIYKNIFSY